MANQHAGIRGTMRFMATGTAFEAHWSMFERERSALVAMALEASRFASERCPHGLGLEAGVGIVAIDAGHGGFGKPVFIGTLEGGPYRQMARCTLSIDGGDPANLQRFAGGSVDGMTGRATDFIFCVAAEYPARSGLLIQMAGETTGVELVRFLFAGIVNIGCRGGLGVFSARPVTGLAGITLPAAMLVAFKGAVGGFEEGSKDLFVASLAGLRASIRRTLGRSRARSGRH
jgi:hypothetical protein